MTRPEPATTDAEGEADDLSHEPVRTATMSTDPEPTDEELRASRCWERDDQVPNDPPMTRFRRTARYHQTIWREAREYPIGSQPHRPRPDQLARPVGSRIELDYAVSTGANLITPAALDAARTRTSFIEPHQSLDHQRLWADLLSSEALAFNLFGDLANDSDAATSLVHGWFPDAPGPVTEIRFAHSPGRLDPSYLNSLRAFPVAAIVDAGDGRRGIVAIDIKYHELMKPETPKPANRARNLEVASRSGIFRDGSTEALTRRSAMCETWLEHLLLLSMLQHPHAGWTWGRYVVLHPADNTNVVRTLDDYRDRLTDPASVTTITLDHWLDEAPLLDGTRRALRARYTRRGYPSQRVR